MLKRLFPTLAEWPLEKWLVVPLAFLMLLAILGGLCDLLFGPRVLD